MLVSIGLEKLVAIFRQEMCRIACIIQLIQEYPTRICKKPLKYSGCRIRTLENY